MSFLGKLADQINSQLTTGENENHTLDAVVDGQNQKYGSLGDFAKKFDQSSERRYTEEGYLRKDPFNTDPKQYEILMQEPSATIMVKKRMFSSVNENFRPDYMDADEKLYFKAMKVLFANKCRQISALERLSKIQKITSAVGNVSDQLMPIIMTLTDEFNGTDDTLSGVFGKSNTNGDMSNFSKVIDRVRRLYAFNNTNNLTTWVTDPTNLFQSQFGQGTGVIEITNFTNLNTSVTLSLNNPGGFDFTIVDPYEAMLITDYDIERALSDATNSFYNHKIVQFGQQGAEQVIADATTRLNQLRRDRKVSPISFKVNPDTLLGRRVVAIVDRQGVELPFDYNSGFGGIGSDVTVAKEYQINGAVLGIEGLDTKAAGILPGHTLRAAFPESELAVFGRLVTAIFTKLQLDANTRGAFVTTNKLTNYARRKLRFNFCGKLIIQPMDTVHIYMNTKSRYDGKLLSGLQNMFTGSGILQNINKTVVDLKNQIDTVFNPGGSVNFQIEKASFVGSEFPNYLWSLIRNQFVTEKEGTHVCAGVVQSAQDSWSDGKFSVSVRGVDNTTYFEMGKINFKPSTDVFNGAFYDPLTPFKTRFDTISSEGKGKDPQLLDENKALLGSSKDLTPPLTRNKSGPGAGLPSHEDNMFQDLSIDKGSRSISKVFHAPDGLVYKWKEGIGTLVQFGNSGDLGDPSKIGNVTQTKEPFAGQDVMNVLSLLITGQPYNFATYWKTVVNFDGFGKDPQSQQDSAHSYFESLQTDLQKNNSIWGNFIPFKNLTVDEQTYKSMLNSQMTVTRNNKDIESKLKELASAQQYANMFASTEAIFKSSNDKYSSYKATAQSRVADLQKEIEKLLSENQKSANGLIDHGGDITLDSNAYLGTDSKEKQAADVASKRLLRRQVNYLTRRMSYNVRGNEDKNLFIVDDVYDKDYDIAAYEQSLSNGLSLYNNEFASVKDKISAASELLNLEVFADTQGHIRVRPPQYNRMPGSIFYRMMFLKKSTGIQVFPQFLEDLFGDQIKSLTERLEVIEDQVRLYCALIGVINQNDTDDLAADGKCEDFLQIGGPSSGNGEYFTFVSDASTGSISDLVTAVQSANPSDKAVEKIESTKLGQQAISTKSSFTNNQKYQSILNAVTGKKLSDNGYGIMDKDAFSNNTRIDRLIARIYNKSGIRIDKTSFLLSSDILKDRPDVPSGATIDIFAVTQKISDAVRDRQKTVKLLYGAVKNAVEAKYLDDDSSASSSLLTPGVYRNSHIPEIFEHMIEDETYDDYGPESGKRYIIKRAQIKQISISETPPDFTEVVVQGRLDPFVDNSSLPGDLNVFPSNGNSLVTASAIDYDTWRNYGFRQTSPINVPFLSDPSTQCAPYATMVLSRARRDILRGSVTIAGNEFMQPGEVIFLEDRGMLFYVTSVKHAFTSGTSFSTTLDLRYGHTPGEYIPTTLDVIGKLIYNNRDTSNVIIQRQASSFSEKSVGILIMDANKKNVVNVGDKKDTPNSFSAANTQTINNILFNTAYMLNANKTKNNTVKATIELRIYSDVNNKIDPDLKAFAESMMKMLTDPAAGPKQNFNQVTGSVSNAPADSDFVKIVEVDMSDKTQMASPSQKAHDAARNYQNIKGMSGGGASAPGQPSVQGFGSALAGVGSALKNSFNASDGGQGTSEGEQAAANLAQRAQLRAGLMKYIVDVWVKYTDIPPAQAKANGT